MLKTATKDTLRKLSPMQNAGAALSSSTRPTPFCRGKSTIAVGLHGTMATKVCVHLASVAEILWFMNSSHGFTAIFRRIVLRMLDTFNGITFLIADGKLFQGEAESPGRELLSRVNASFLFPPLEKDQTVEIFELNMRWINELFSKQHWDDPRPSCLVVDEDILEFARAFYDQRQPDDRWNCRQIRKAFSTALALAHADAEVSSEVQDDGELQNPLKVNLKATHFEVVARSNAGSTEQLILTRPPDSGQSIDARMRQRPSRERPTAWHRMAPQQRQPPQRQPQQFLPQQRPPQQMPPGMPLPNNRQLPPVEYRTQMLPPPPPPTEPAMVDIVRPEYPKGFFLTSPLSLEARPELLFLDWDAFKGARTQKGNLCSAIDILKGEPVVSFDQEAQDSVWWSRWGDRNRGDGPKAKSDANAANVHKGRSLAGTHPMPLPERIRIHSKYVTVILEEIRGTRISKNSFVMVRPFRALTYYEEKIRARYKSLGMKLERSPDDPCAEEESPNSPPVEQPGSSATEVRPDHPGVILNDGSHQRQGPKSSNDDSLSDYSSSSYVTRSDDPEAVDTSLIDTSPDAAFQHLSCLVKFLDMIRARREYIVSGSCSKVTFADV